MTTSRSSPLITYRDTRYRQAISADERSTCRRSRPRQLLRQQLVARSFDMSKEIEHVQFVSTCRKDEKIVRRVAKTATCQTATFDISKQRSTCCFDMMLVWTRLDSQSQRFALRTMLPVMKNSFVRQINFRQLLGGCKYSSSYRIVK